MNFETEFDLNEHAWYMEGNKPTEIIISAIEIFEVGTNQSYTKYKGRNSINPVSWLDHQNLLERRLFKSKGELLKSLFGGGIVCKGKNCSALNGVDHSNECIKEHESC